MSLSDTIKREESFSTAGGDREKGHISHAAPCTLPAIKEDEANKVLDEYREEAAPTPEELKVVRRKLDFVLMPLMFIIYGLNYTDKNIASTAINFGLAEDLHLFYHQADGKLNTGRYSNTTTIYYVGFVVGAPVMAMVARRYPTGKVCACAVTAWGLTCMANAWCTSYAGMMVQRTFLGFCEAGVQPCFILLTGAFYTKHEQILRHALWWAGAGGSVPITTAVNYGFLHFHGAIASWRILFYFWGSFTVAFGIFLLFALPDSPVNAWVLTPRQRYVAVERLRVNQGGVENRHFHKRQAWEAVKDYNTLMVGLMIFLISTCNALVSAFTQTLFKQLLHTSAYRAMVLNIPGGVLSAVVTLTTGLLGIKFKNITGLLSLICQVIVLIGAILLWTLPHTSKGGLFAGIYLMAFFIGAVVCTYTFVTSNTAGYTKKAVVTAWFVVCNNAANAAAPKFFLPTQAPAYTSGFIAIAICYIGCIVITCLYVFLNYRENKRRDAMGEAGKEDRAFQDLTDRENLSFRYTL